MRIRSLSARCVLLGRQDVVELVFVRARVGNFQHLETHACRQYQSIVLCRKKLSCPGEEVKSVEAKSQYPVLQASSLLRLVILRASFGASVAAVHLAVTAEVGNHGEMAATTFNLAGKRLLASVAVHVRLQGAWAREALVADFALVLLLRAR